jgi:hypothetical protein
MTRSNSVVERVSRNELEAIEEKHIKGNKNIIVSGGECAKKIAASRSIAN